METIVDLPEALVREIELRAVREGRQLKDLIAELLVAGLSPGEQAPQDAGPIASKDLPLIDARRALPGDANQLTTQQWCDWIKNVDLALDVERHEKALGHQHLDRTDP